MEQFRERITELRENLTGYSIDQKRAIVGICLVALSISTFLFFASKGEAVETPPIKIVETAPTKMLLIHVAGEVKRPGVYPVVEGSRVVDALAAAGGAKKGVDLSQINLARKLVDGEQIYLGLKGSGSKTSGVRRGTFAGVVYVNRATASQFDSLDGIGPVLAKRIVEYRNTNGPFVDIADLQKVPGIGAKTFAKIQSRLSL